MVAAFKSVYGKLEETGHASTLHAFDNKCSCAVRDCITSQKVPIQIVEPDNHRTNATEPAGKSMKYHIISSTATVDLN